MQPESEYTIITLLVFALIIDSLVIYVFFSFILSCPWSCQVMSVKCFIKPNVFLLLSFYIFTVNSACKLHFLYRPAYWIQFISVKLSEIWSLNCRRLVKSLPSRVHFHHINSYWIQFWQVKRNNPGGLSSLYVTVIIQGLIYRFWEAKLYTEHLSVVSIFFSDQDKILCRKGKCKVHQRAQNSMWL